VKTAHDGQKRARALQFRNRSALQAYRRKIYALIPGSQRRSLPGAATTIDEIAVYIIRNLLFPSLAIV